MGPRANSGRLPALRRTARMLLTTGRASTIEWQVANLARSAQASRSGYWEDGCPVPPGLSAGWHEIHAQPTLSSPAGLLVPDLRNRVRIISDIDDALLVTQVLRKRTLVLNSLTLSPEKRRPVDGMAEFYRRLSEQNPAPAASPIFYLSSSPRQLTDNPRRFLAGRRFPRGILLLRKIEPRRHGHIT